jgi:hypothetical protein
MSKLLNALGLAQLDVQTALAGEKNLTPKLVTAAVLQAATKRELTFQLFLMLETWSHNEFLGQRTHPGVLNDIGR